MKNKKLIDITDDTATYVLEEHFDKYRQNQLKLIEEPLSSIEVVAVLEEQYSMEIHDKAY